MFCTLPRTSGPGAARAIRTWGPLGPGQGGPCAGRIWQPNYVYIGIIYIHGEIFTTCYRESLLFTYECVLVQKHVVHKELLAQLREADFISTSCYLSNNNKCDFIYIYICTYIYMIIL